jgi:thiosulfate reductase/polysulfide reductase chain A
MSKLKAVTDFKLSRRTFLKATGALGAAVALADGPRRLLSKDVALAQDEGAQIIPTWCHGCTTTKTNCAVLCHVEDGKFVRIEGNPDAGNNWGLGSTSLCVKAHSAMQYAYAPNRILYPMKRVGEKGEGKFERITWDEALDTIAAKLKEVKDEYGPEAYGWLSPESFPVSALARRFLNVYGSPNYLHSAICATNRRAASAVTVGFQSEAPDDWSNSNLIVIWGSNCENSSVNRGKPNAILDAVQKGVQLIDIRPMMNPMGSKADVWLGIRPGTDCALALAILNVIITEKLYDVEFVSEWCYGFEKLEAHVQQYTPEWAATVTGIPTEKIVDVARMMATIKPMCISTGNGVGDQACDGTATIMSIRLISALTGNIDVPGAIGSSIPVGPSLIPTKGINSLADRTTPDILDKLGWPEFPRWYQKAGSTTSAYFKGMNSILTGEPYPLRVVCGQHTNPFGATRQPKVVAEALKKLDFYFVMDIYWNPSTPYADIVLPASSLYERDHQFGVKNMPEGTWIGIRNKILEPQGESRSDWQFWLDLGVKMGYGEDFWNGSMDDCLREQLEGSGVTLEELRAAPTGIFVARTEPPSPPTYRKYAQLFKNLPHGKVQCYNEMIGGKEDCMGTGTLPYLPEFKGAPESIAGTPELTAEYPLVLSDVHADRRCQHSSLINLPYLRELQPYPWVRINPATAKKYGINDGDWMKVESPNGWIKMVAEYFEGIAPDVLMTRRGWWLECEELDLPAYGIGDGGSEVNVMYNTDIDLFDKFASQMPKQTLVKISKA